MDQGAPPSEDLSAALRKHFSDDAIAKMIRELCTATRRTENGIEPDWATRRDGLKLALAYRIGLPIQRREEIKRQDPGDNEVIDRLATKIGYRSALRNYIESLDKRDVERLETLAASRPVR